MTKLLARSADHTGQHPVTGEDTEKSHRSNLHRPNLNWANLDWRRKMSDHVAFALLVYTCLQIFLTMSVLKTNHKTILPYLALVVLVAAIIPACRTFELRWSELSDEQASNPDLARDFARDRMAIWLSAVGLPFAMTALFTGLELLLG